MFISYINYKFIKIMKISDEGFIIKAQIYSMLFECMIPYYAFYVYVKLKYSFFRYFFLKNKKTCLILILNSRSSDMENHFGIFGEPGRDIELMNTILVYVLKCVL
jgi:hypothetical protein